MAAIAAGETQDFVEPLTDPDLDTCRVFKQPRRASVCPLPAALDRGRGTGSLHFPRRIIPRFTRVLEPIYRPATGIPPINILCPSDPSKGQGGQICAPDLISPVSHYKPEARSGMLEG
jgi:hypothetical protein